MTLATLSFLLQASLPGAAQTPSSHFRIVEIAEGVYAALQPERLRFQDSSAVILVNEQDLMVVDAQGNPTDVRQLITQIRGLTDKPVGQVVVTHGHSDHVWSFALYREAFGEDVELVSHASLRADIPELAHQIDDERQGLSEALRTETIRLQSQTTRDGEPMSEDAVPELALDI
jgi:glyoxylase-like metal-dependent hydrolase (beta-lactamase superfamily II)